MKLLVLYVPGLAQRTAIRPDLARNLSALMEVGGFVPVFPVFPALPGPMQMTLHTGRHPEAHGVVGGSEARPPADSPLSAGFETIPDLDRAARELGPAHPDMAERFRAVDAAIGERVDRARAEGRETVVVSDGAGFPVTASIPLADFSSEGSCVAEEQVCHVRTPDPPALARRARELDPGIKALVTPRDKALYRIGHPNCGDVVLIAPPSKRFGPPGPRGTRGHLPLREEDYGVVVSALPVVEPPRGRSYLLAVEVAAWLRERLAQ